MALRKGQYGLQVLKDGTWQWVFSTVENRPGTFATCKDYKKALPASDLDYFAKRFGNHQFRAVKIGTEG